jgi:sulfatase maturation enzyme AslB (radical SAM superfamily)
MTTIPEKAPPAFHLPAKPTGAVCNLDCQYSFFLGEAAQQALRDAQAWLLETEGQEP